jgi:hypothetical protein
MTCYKTIIYIFAVLSDTIPTSGNTEYNINKLSCKEQ